MAGTPPSATGASIAGQTWLRQPPVAAALEALGGTRDEVRLVGGCVRDSLLGLAVADIDMATIHLPGPAGARLAERGFRIIPTGIEHGTLTAVLAGVAIEVTTLRRDVSTDGRRATVAFSTDWQADAARRDFTINALSADCDGAVHDYFDGLADLAARRVRFIGDPDQRIAEDALRILRYFRFQARFGSHPPDPASLAACGRNARKLMALSRERVRDETLKLLAAPDPVPTLRLMRDQAVLAAFLPEAGAPDTLERLIARENILASPDALRRLAAILPDEAARADAIGHRLRLSTRDRKRLAAMAGRWPLERLSSQALAEVAAYTHGVEAVVDQLLLSPCPPADWQVLVANLASWQRPRLPLSGKDLIARGLPEGPLVSQTLRAIESDWCKAGFPLAPETLEALIAARMTGAEGQR